MSSSARSLALIGLLCLTTECALHAQTADAAKITDEGIARAETISYCDAQQDPEKFKDRMIRVRGLYESDFEKSTITAPACYGPFMTWVVFNKQWESRSNRRVRHALLKQKWGVQADVVFVGLLMSEGHYGHEDMYPLLFDVYKVEAVRPSGSFRPMPEERATQQ